MSSGLLLDTNVILYWFFDSKKLANVVGGFAQKKLHVSPISLWEVIIKNQIGKLPLPIPIEEYVDLIENNFHLLAWSKEDLITYSKLPLHHRDPFDRMIISQAINESLCLVSTDNQISKYGVESLIYRF